MATTKIWKVDCDLSFTINYAKNPDKTVTMWAETSDGDKIRCLGDVIKYAADRNKTIDETSVVKKEYVTGINCCADTAFREMILTKYHYCKTDKILAWHGYQSFAPGEVTPELAHEIGVKLAEKLFGDRFQVVVTTHLDRSHIHNHFVVNSVSFTDGKKYYATRASYLKMRMESDALCREYGLSVIENPTYNGVTMGEYKAEKKGRYTIGRIVREDMDRMVSESIGFSDFMRRMKNAGYKVNYSGKYLTVTPCGHKAIRCDRRWGQDYSIEGLEKRIEMNLLRGRIRSSVNLRASNTPYPSRRLSGYRGLYAANLHRMGKYGYSRRQMHFLIREDLLKLDTIKGEMDFIRKNNIVTDKDLEREKEKRKGEYKTLSEKRKRIRNRIRRASPLQRDAAVKELDAVNNRIKILRRELFYANDIMERATLIKEKQEKIREIERGNSHGRRK